MGTIYRHFGSKEGLLREIALEAVADFERDVGDSEQSAEPAAALHIFLAALLRATDSYGWLFDAMLGGHLPEEASEGLEGVEAGARLSAILERGGRSRAFRRNIDLQVASSLLLGLCLTWKYGHLRDSMTIIKAVDLTVAIFQEDARVTDA